MAEENVTVMILRGVKRVRCIKINRSRIRFVVVCCSIFTLLFVVSVGLNFYQYIYLNGSQQFVQTLFQDTEPELGGVPVSGTNGNENFATGIEQQNGTLRANGIPQKSTHDDSIDDKELDVFAKDLTSSIVELVDLKESLQMNGAELNMTFSIYKKDIPQEAVSGRFFIVAKTTDANNPYLSYPQVELNNDGSVKNTMIGENFYMRKLTPKKGQIFLIDRTAEFEYYRIYIYSNSGELLLQRTQMIDRSSLE